MSVHLLTGAGSGIGSALATRLRARGDDLVLLARSAARAAQLEQRFPGARTVAADLAAPTELASALAQQELPDRLDSVIHVAGVVDLGPVADMPVALWTAQVNVNLVGPAELTRLLLPAVRAAQGQILFVNSGAGLRAAPDWAAYAASKHGLKALADSLRAEEAPHGVRVSSVFPGRTATAMQERVHEQEGKPYDPAAFIDPESVVTSMLTVLDLPRDAQIPELTIRPGV
ncbi:SDR family oxidoreductase [Microbacterium lushaniae]|uniref:SDR family oxidoreductase n=1 Tax=Microbacterium lushaniae TaxID=2614639 RepID=A0A5J6L5K7_9MICO|nr:SDR family oxidoreductase [Microbacterium lushaniae]QEW03612.1 SDR family oxidoreductase [Microbacterium lushaniae]